ncbi:MAG: SMC-Scp complex subunit ScpB [Halothermotrichaceae bacterium]
MDIKKLSTIEALIFSAEKAMSVKDIANAVDLTKKQCREYIEVLEKEYSKDSHGIDLKEYNDGYLFVTKPDYSSIIKDIHNKKVTRLTQAALETLAIIAYKQPVTRAEIEEIRGVKAEKTLLTLTKYELIEELGRKETIGNPIVYGTTKEFLRQFDIKDLSDLPEVNIEEIQDKNTAG